MNETKKRLYVDRTGFWAEAAVLLMVLAIVFRLIGSIGRWNDMDYLVTQLALPALAALLFVLFVLFFGKRAFWTTMIPVVLGVVYFIFRVMPMEGEWQKVAFIALYVVIVVLYAMTFSHPFLKWILALILALAFAYHLAILDLPELLKTEGTPVSFVEGMDEMSILMVILSVLSISLAMRYPAGPKEDTNPKPEALQEPVPAEPPVEPEPVPAFQPSQNYQPAQSYQPAQEPGFFEEPAPAFQQEEPETPKTEAPPAGDEPENA